MGDVKSGKGDRSSSGGGGSFDRGSGKVTLRCWLEGGLGKEEHSR